MNKNVTQGQFDIPVTGTTGLAAANQASTFTAMTISGTFSMGRL